MTVLSTATAPLARVTGADLCVPIEDGSVRTYANFDYAASAPALTQVAARIDQLLHTYSSVHRGAGYASKVSTDNYENAREVVARFVGATDDHVVVFTRNTTDSLNLLAGCVPGSVVVLDIEHHANLLPWKGSRIVRAADTVEETIRALVAELCTRPTALVAITGASNVTGEVLPIARIADIAHRLGARILVDAAQLAPHREIDIDAWGVDYLAFSGHKLYAPFGAGVLVGRRDWLDSADPYLAGGGAVREVTVEATKWAPSPARHEAGTPNVLGAGALAAACETIEGLGFCAIAEHEGVLREQLVAGLESVRGLEFLSLWPDSCESVGILTFTIAGYEPREIATYLSDSHGIGVRDGRFCAHPLLARLGHAEGAVRASIGLGTSSVDVERLVGALHTLVSESAPA